MGGTVNWLRASRKGFADIWGFLLKHAGNDGAQIKSAVMANRYQFAPLLLVKKSNGERVGIWPSADAYVLKCLAIILTPILPVHIQCTHVIGHSNNTMKRVLSILTRSGLTTLVLCSIPIKPLSARPPKALIGWGVNTT